MGRRGYGEGGITQVRPGVFRLRVRLEDPVTGVRQQFGKTVKAKNLTTAKEKLAEFRKELGERKPEDTPDFSAVVKEWLANVEREGRLAPSTRSMYRSHAENHILPALGALKPAEVDARRLDAFYARLATKGDLEASTVRVIHWVVMAALRQALDWDLVEKLPRARPPTVRREAKPVPTPEQVQALIDRAKASNWHSTALLIRLGAVTGARRGELLGLQVSDYDRDARTLRFQRQVTPEHGVQTTLKGKKPKTLSVGASTARAIDDFLAFNRERFKAEHGPWLLSDDGGVSHLMPNRVSERVARLGKDLGIAVTPHSLRHFFDSHCAAAGIDPVTVAARAGHSLDVAQRHYLHQVDGADRKAAEAMEALFA